MRGTASHLPAGVVTGGAALALVGVFLPWVTSGDRGRSSFDVFELVDRLGFTPDGVVGTALRLWPLAPLLLVITTIGWWLPNRSRASSGPWLGGVTTVTAVYVGGTALAVAVAPVDGLVRIGAGPWVTVAGTATIAAGLVAGRIWSNEGE